MGEVPLSRRQSSSLVASEALDKPPSVRRSRHRPSHLSPQRSGNANECRAGMVVPKAVAWNSVKGCDLCGVGTRCYRPTVNRIGEEKRKAPRGAFRKWSAETREVHHRAANEDGCRDERPEARIGGGGNVIVLRQGRRRRPGFPGEDLEIPGSPGITLLARDEVQHVAVSRVRRKHRGVPGALHRGWFSGLVDHVDTMFPCERSCASCTEFAVTAVPSYSMTWW